MPVYCPSSELQKRARGELFRAASLTFTPELFSIVVFNRAYVNISIEIVSKLNEAKETERQLCFHMFFVLRLMKTTRIL